MFSACLSCWGNPSSNYGTEEKRKLGTATIHPSLHRFILQLNFTQCIFIFFTFTFSRVRPLANLVSRPINITSAFSISYYARTAAFTGLALSSFHPFYTSRSEAGMMDSSRDEWGHLSTCTFHFFPNAINTLH